MLHQINISILIISIIISIYLFLFNLTKRFKFLENKILSIICFFGAVHFYMLLLQLIYYASPNLTLYCRIYYGVVILLCQLLFGLIQVYPKWDKRASIWFSIITAIPGIILLVITIYTDLIIADVKYDVHGALSFTFGKYIILYIVVQYLYFIGTFAVLIYKNLNQQNENFKKQFGDFLMGMSFAGSGFAFGFLYFPYFHDIHYYTPIGDAFFFLTLFVVINYGISNELVPDYKKMYLKVALWLVIFFALIIPTFLLLNQDFINEFLGIKLPPFSSPILIPLLFFLIFWIMRPLADKIIKRKFIQLEKEFDGLYNETAQLSDINYQELGWDYPLNTELDILLDRLKIKNATLYLYNTESKEFIRSHSVGEKIEPVKLNEKSEMVKCLKFYNAIIEKSMFFTDETLWKYRGELFPYIKENNIELILPIFNLERELSAILFLGRLQNENLYTKEFITLFDLFSIQFGYSLVKYMLFEQARSVQVVEHDKMVIGSIKKKIIPASFDRIEGVKLSSLHLDNSEYGGDYFDSVKIDSNRLGIFMTNTFDTGVNSAMLALELYSIFHSQASRYDTPERLINIMNHVIITSKYSDRYATAFYMIYSQSSKELTYTNAAHNPLVLFDTKKDKFIELDSEGIPIGVDREFHYKHKTTRLPPKSIGLFHSDGLSSAVDKEGNSYSISRVMDIIRINKEETPAKLVRKIYEDLFSFVKGSAMLNDISLVLFRTD